MESLDEEVDLPASSVVRDVRIERVLARDLLPILAPPGASVRESRAEGQQAVRSPGLVASNRAAFEARGGCRSVSTARSVSRHPIAPSRPPRSNSSSWNLPLRFSGAATLPPRSKLDVQCTCSLSLESLPNSPGCQLRSDVSFVGVCTSPCEVRPLAEEAGRVGSRLGSRQTPGRCDPPGHLVGYLRASISAPQWSRIQLTR